MEMIWALTLVCTCISQYTFHTEEILARYTRENTGVCVCMCARACRHEQDREQMRAHQEQAQWSMEQEREEMRTCLEQERTAKEEETKQKDALRRTLRAAENKGKKLEVNA